MKRDDTDAAARRQPPTSVRSGSDAPPPVAADAVWRAVPRPRASGHPV